MTDVATRYYIYGNSQIEIARDLGLDPSTISRYLKRARDDGIVRVEIVPPRRKNLELGLALTNRFGLGRAVVAELTEAEGDPIAAVAAVAADFLADQLRHGMRVGIGWGATIAAVVAKLTPGVVSEIQVAQLAGGLADAEPGIQGHELARMLVELYPDSRAVYLHAPSIVDSQAICAALLADRSIQAALAAAAQSELALVGIGEMDPGATLLTASHISAAERDTLIAEGAIGSMNSRLYNRAGQPAGHLDGRTVALEWQALAAIPTVIAVAAGSAKVAAIRAGLRTDCVNVLVTDEATAAALLAG